MIRYRLNCEKGHGFEAWFANSKAYDDQAARGLVSCPHCGSSEISKAPMAPNITRGGKGKTTNTLLKAARLAREHVVKTSEYVGDRFADEALRIHHKETEPRGIYGEATENEAETLREEGVEFYPLPVLPEDHN
jgi:hypothetical protein